MEESQSIRNLAVDPSEEKMYFISGGIVSRANFDGSRKEMIRGSSVRAFALDSAERSMYWLNGVHMYKGNMNFSGEKYLGFWATGNLAIDPYSRLVMHFLGIRTQKTVSGP